MTELATPPQIDSPEINQFSLSQVLVDNWQIKSNISDNSNNSNNYKDITTTPPEFIPVDFRENNQTQNSENNNLEVGESKIDWEVNKNFTLSTSLLNDVTTKSFQQDLGKGEVNIPNHLNFANVEVNSNSQLDNTPAATSNPSNAKKIQNKTSSNFKLQTFPVGVSIGRHNVQQSMLVRGWENGSEAIKFADWLLPYDRVIKIFGFDSKNLPDGKIELRSLNGKLPNGEVSPIIATRIDPAKLTSDSKLGLAFSIRDLQEYFGVSAKFDLQNYAIRLYIPKVNHLFRPKIEENPVEVDNLPTLRAPEFSVSSVSPQLTLQGGENQSLDWHNHVNAIGTVFGGSWFLSADRIQFQKTSRWNLAQAQYLRQTQKADYILGSQTPFWSDIDGSFDYWGFTTIQRQGFSSAKPNGSIQPQRRLQANQLGRKITGQAEPGTLVQLVEYLNNRLVDQVLVDSDRIYQFDNVAVNGNFSSTKYRLYLYPQGRLTSPPQVRKVNLNSVPGQLPKGGSALVISGGVERKFDNSFLGEFTGFRGGIAQRWGVSSDLTIGLGAIHNGSLRGLTELYWQPRKLPLLVEFSTLTPGITGNNNQNWGFNSNITFQPDKNFHANFRSNFNRSLFHLNWRFNPKFSVFSSIDSQNPAKLGVQFIRTRPNSFTFARVNVNTANQWQWNLLQRLGQVELLSNGNSTDSQSELAYNFSNTRYSKTGHALVLGYQTRFSSGQNNDIFSLNWRYRSQKQTYIGSPLWETELGYGVGSKGSGLIASVTTSILPGLKLRAKYQGASLTSDDSTFRLEFTPSFDFNSGLRNHRSRHQSLRTQGGVRLRAFFDKNNNGKRDKGEKLYADNLKLLAVLNNKPLNRFRPGKTKNSISINLPPGKHRLNLDPAGFPFDWQAVNSAYAVEVVAGSYTQVEIPLVPAYTLSGVIKDQQGKAIAGATVEAIDSTTGKRYFSVTNSAGVYYLEHLSQGKYLIKINGKELPSNQISLSSDSENWQKINLNF
ncbi:MAG: carboxypeptidase-like regulatory domain-containing protein [Cyanobacteria bacterium P01_A01_bin.84]